MFHVERKGVRVNVKDEGYDSRLQGWVREAER